MVKAIIFDLDNTLVNFWEFKQESADEAARAMVGAGLEMNEKRVRDLIFKIYETHGIEYQLTFSELLKPFKFEKPKFERIRNAAITAYLRKKSQMLRPYEGVEQMLCGLGGEYRLAVLTDAAKEQAHQRLEFVNLQKYFEAIGTFHDTNIYKPGVEPFLFISKKLSLEPSDCLMVGDNPSRDIKGAKSAGMKTCFAKYGHNYGNDGTVADFEIEKPQELIELVKRM
ncbi:MAG: HAD-IA family hydrolase [Candidatus Micrarchaeia archaeon]